MDITTVVLPLPILWGLQMPASKKFILSGMFSMGITYVLNNQRCNALNRLIRKHRICAITGVRIKVTTEINSPDPQVQWALNALLVNLEVMLGITNACLPVMKPVLNKLGEIRPFTALSIWISQWNVRNNSDAADRHILSRGRNQNRSSHIRRDSYHIFSDDHSPKAQAPKSKFSTFPQQLLSKPYRPQNQWDNGSLEMASGKRGQVITHIEVGHHHHRT